MTAPAIRPQSTTVTIVVTGSFVPDAFHPNALAQAGIIAKKDAKSASARALLSGLIIQFDLGWGELFVSTDRFQIGTVQAPYVRVCDFAVKALREIESPINLTAFGINVESHFDLGSVKARDAVGCRLAPPKAWGKWGAAVEQNMSTVGPLHGGLVMMQMRQPFQGDHVAGFLDVVVGPSNKVGDNSGVYFRTNHHHGLSSSAQKPAATADANSRGLKLLDDLIERFDGSVEAAENLFVDVLEGKGT